MPPRNFDAFVGHVNDAEVRNEVEPVVQPQFVEPKRPPMRIVWRNVVWFAYLHLAALYGLFLLPSCQIRTLAFTVAVYYMSAWGITAGAHRLWSHKSYKAKLPFRILLAIFNSMAFQNDIIEWSRDHRVHHKYSETEADPHNAKRGFFFSHCGWLMVRKHPEVKEKGKAIDLSDLLADPVCAIQRKVYVPSMVLLCFIMPTVVPWYFWGESAWTSFFVCAILRYTTVLNFTWCINSVAHMFGNKPYDKNINPVENILATCGAAGEGFHNYHHTFPYDYAASEYGTKLNPTTVLINFMALIGQAYDLKSMSQEMIDRRKQRTGDGSTGFGYTTQHEQQEQKKED